MSFSTSLAREAKVCDGTKCLSLNDETYMVRPSLIDFNPVELRSYPFMISLDKCSGNCNVLSQNNMCSKKTKVFKVFNMITNRNEAKTIAKHIQQVISIKIGMIKHVTVNVKSYRVCKTDYSWNPSRCICENE